MWLYLILFVISVVLYFYSIQSDKAFTKFIFAYMLSLGIFVGFSDMLGGYDRYIYGELFDDLADKIQRGSDISDSAVFFLYRKEFGYAWINLLIAQFTANRYIFILIVTLIVYILTFSSMLKYTNRSPLIIVLFMGLWFFFTFTYLRQVLAASICWLSIRYVIDRKPVPFFLLILFSSSIHNSAIIFSLTYFIPLRKLSRKTVVLIMSLCLLFGLLGMGIVFEQYSTLMDAEQRAAKYIEDTSGFRFAYLLEAIVFLAFILCRYDEIDEKNKTQVEMLNLSLIFCAILLLFVKSENGGRLSWFFMMGLISILSYLATRSNKISFYNISLIGICVFLYIRILLGWNIMLYPYKTFLSNGSREGDFIHMIYEYDNRYDNNKFYR